MPSKSVSSLPFEDDDELELLEDELDDDELELLEDAPQAPSDAGRSTEITATAS